MDARIIARSPVVLGGEGKAGGVKAPVVSVPWTPRLGGKRTRKSAGRYFGRLEEGEGSGTWVSG
jgi:hypothetical protein